MRIDDELEAYHLLSHVSYYRLKGYDKELRILLFGAIETIEVALRTKLIYHLS